MRAPCLRTNLRATSAATEGNALGITRIGCVTLLCVVASAAPAGAANRIEGYWAHEGDNVTGLVEVTPGGAVGAYKGIVIRRVIFGSCAHRPPEHMWQLIDQADGTYRGSHVNYTREGCRPVQGAHALLRVRKTPGGDVLDFCVTPPEEEPPAGFTDDCHKLKRVGHARDLARMCSTGPVRASRARARRKDICVTGPSELRRYGCVRQSRQRRRFSVNFISRSDSDDVAVNRGSRANAGMLDGRARIKWVRFALDGRAKRTDRKAPFQLLVRRSALDAGDHGLLAAVSIVVPKTKTEPRKRVQRRVFFEFGVCK